MAFDIWPIILLLPFCGPLRMDLGPVGLFFVVSNMRVGPSNSKIHTQCRFDQRP